MRMHGHGAHDDMSYVPAEMLERVGASATRSSATRARLVAEHGFAADEVEAIRAEVERRRRRVRRAGARLADARPGDWPREGVFAERCDRRSATATRRGRAGRRPPRRERIGRELTYLEAISDGLREEMRRDESVFCLGEDIGAFGGAFKVTDGFIEEFGAERVLDTPLAENAIIGAAVGAAIEGMRPVCEMQFADFIACGFDQLVNVAAKLHYRQGVAVPMVVRLPSGGGFSGGPFHSQNPEAWFLQAPGLKVVAPATAADAKGLLAERDPRPQPGLLPRAQGPLPPRQGRGAGGRARSPIGKARVAREGERDDRDRLRLGGPRSRSRRPRSSTSRSR